MRGGPVRKIATEAARELSPFAPATHCSHIRAGVTTRFRLLQRADPRYSLVPGSVQVPVLYRTSEPGPELNPESTRVGPWPLTHCSICPSRSASPRHYLLCNASDTVTRWCKGCTGRLFPSMRDVNQ